MRNIGPLIFFISFKLKLVPLDIILISFIIGILLLLDFNRSKGITGFDCLENLFFLLGKYLLVENLYVCSGHTWNNIIIIKTSFNLDNASKESLTHLKKIHKTEILLTNFFKKIKFLRIKIGIYTSIAVSVKIWLSYRYVLFCNFSIIT